MSDDRTQTTRLDPVTAMHAKQDPIGNTLGQPLLDKTVRAPQTTADIHLRALIARARDACHAMNKILVLDLGKLRLLGASDVLIAEVCNVQS